MVCSVARACLALFLFASASWCADWKAGVGRAVITPDGPIYLSGYGARNHPSEGVIHDLWAKALALEDRRGGRVVIVTTDVIGLPRWLTDLVAARVQKAHGLDRARLVINSSHTHTGPYIRGNLPTMFALAPDDQRVVEAYSQRLADTLVTVIDAAIRDLAPAEVSSGNGAAGFAINRREPSPNGVRIGENPAGPVDKDVPVLRVTGADGKLRVVLFGYACHNTTLTGEFYKISGDYAGFAQLDLERQHPGSTAMFLMLCGADQNPHPRSTLALAEQHGQTLATEVSRVLGSKMRPVHGLVRPAFEIVELGLAPHSRETFEARLHDPNPSRVRHAQAMLRDYDDRHPIRRYPYPVQAVALGRDWTLIALGGEVVVDYALRLKREYGATGLVVAGYSNDVMSYIPSLRVLREGGYEPDTSMLGYGLPGPYDAEVEDRIFGAIHSMMSKRLGRRPRRLDAATSGR